MARVYYSTTGVSRNTTTSTTPQDQATLTFTPNASKVYVLLWGCLLDNSSTTTDSLARLYNSTDAAALQTFNFEAQDTTDTYQIAGAAIYTAPGSPGSMSFKVQYYSESTNTTGCQDAWLIALELDADDFQSVTAAEQTSTSTSMTGIGPSVTLPAGDYLLIASAEINTASVGSNSFEIYDGSSQLTVTGNPFLQDTTNYTPWWQILRVTPGSSTTYSLRYQAQSGNTVRSRNTTLVALDLSNFADAIYGDSLGESSTTNNFATTKLTVTDTPLAMDYLELFSCGRRHDSTSNSALVYYDRASSQISVTASREANSVSPGDWYDHGWGAVTELAASSTTWRTRYYAEATGTTRIKNAAFVALGLEDGVTTYTITANLNAAISKTSAATASLNAAVQKAQTAAASLDSAIQRGQTQTASLDAAVQMVRTASADLDAVLQAAFMQTADMDAVVQKAQTADAAMDAAIQVGAAVSAQLSAAIQAARTATASMDAVITAGVVTRSVTAAMDAAIQAARSATAGMDAYIATAEVVVEVVSGGGGGWKKRKADFTDWWVEWSKARKMRRDRKLAKEVEQYREQAAPRVLAALDAEEVERVARLEAELRAIEYGRRELATKQAIDRLVAQIAAVREVLRQAELEADDEDVLLLLT